MKTKVFTVLCLLIVLVFALYKRYDTTITTKRNATQPVTVSSNLGSKDTASSTPSIPYYEALEFDLFHSENPHTTVSTFTKQPWIVVNKSNHYISSSYQGLSYLHFTSSELNLFPLNNNTIQSHLSFRVDHIQPQEINARNFFIIDISPLTHPTVSNRVIVEEQAYGVLKCTKSNFPWIDVDYVLLLDLHQAASTTIDAYLRS